MEEPRRYKVHSSYIWLGGAKLVLVILMAVIFSSISAIVELMTEVATRQGGSLGGAVLGAIAIGLVVLVLVLVLGLSFAGRAWGYRHLWYELGPSEFSLYSGILNKKRVHVPYARVQSIDQRASLIQRLVGVCMVSIDTAGGANNKAIVVPYVTRGQAEQLRAQLFARKQLAVIEAQPNVNPTVLAAARNAVLQVDQGIGLPGTAPAGAGMPGAPAAPMGGGMPGAPAAPMGGGMPGAPAAPMGGGMPGAPAATAGAGVPGAAAPIPATPDQGNLLDMPDGLMQDVGDLFGGAVYDTGKVTFEYGLSNKELVLTGLSNGTGLVLVLFALLAGVMQLYGVFADLAPSVANTVASTAAAAVSGPMWAYAVGTIALAFIGFGLVLWLLSALKACVSFGGFRARRRDNRIEVERGLLSRQFQGVSVDRVQSVIIKQSFIRRLMGYCEVSLGKIDAAADPNDTDSAKLAQGGLVIHPFVKVARVPEILQGLIPEFADLPQDLRPVAPVALRRAIVRRCLWQGGGFWLAVCVALAQAAFNGLWWATYDPDLRTVASLINSFCWIGYGLAAVLVVVDLLGAIFWARESSFGVNGRFMSVRNGGLSRETMAFPRNKIQFGYTRTNPLQRMAHTTTIVATTAAGVGSTSVRLIDVPAEEGMQWLDWLKPRVCAAASPRQPSNP